ncbi:MAG: hypothetical protein ACOC1V_04820 [Candidatus Saliniplasma sp.]
MIYKNVLKVNLRRFNGINGIIDANISSIDELASINPDELSVIQEIIDVEQDGGVSTSQNLGLVGVIISLLALITAIFAVAKKGGKAPASTEEEFGEEEEELEPIEEDTFEDTEGLEE